MKKNSFIRTISGDPFDIPADRTLFERILEDMNRNSGRFRPAPVWDVERDDHGDAESSPSTSQTHESNIAGCSEETFQKYYSNMKQMLDPWIGCTGLQGISPKIVSLYLDFLKEIDFLNIVPTYFDEDGSLKDEAKKLIITDLGSMVDVNLIDIYAAPSEPLKVIEVGGGYGRLAEALINIYDSNIKYCLVDAVPASILYSYQYLKKTFPNLKIGFYHNDDEFDLNMFDCYIIPAWHFETLNNVTYDIAVNIHSMQEMQQHHVDYYLNLFNRIVKVNGLIYLANEKDYMFRGKWNFPDNWEILLKHRSPRHFTRSSPLEIFRKTNTSARAKNVPYLLRYFESLTLVDHLERIGELHGLIYTLDDSLHQVKNGLVNMANELEARINQLENVHNNKISELEVRINRLESSILQLEISRQNLRHLEKVVIPANSLLKRIGNCFRS